jgi:hypothetical protein
MASSTETSLAEIGAGVYSAVGDGAQKFASVDQGAAGTLAAVAAVTGSRIRILAACLQSYSGSGAPTITFKSGTTQLSGEIDSTQVISIVLPYNPAGWMQTAEGEAFNIVSTNGAVNGMLVYEEVAGA